MVHRSYHGYQTANYALSEVRDPVRTMRIAGPLAVGLVTVLFLFVNLAYFAVVSKADILLSGHMAGYASRPTWKMLSTRTNENTDGVSGRCSLGISSGRPQGG